MEMFETYQNLFQGIEGCKQFTFQASDNVCLAWQECVDFSAESCPDCISGDVTCGKQCSVAGLCTSESIDYKSDVPTEEECSRYCYNAGKEKCQFYNYDLQTRLCTFMQDCYATAPCETAGTCKHGERQCYEDDRE